MFLVLLILYLSQGDTRAAPVTLFTRHIAMLDLSPQTQPAVIYKNSRSLLDIIWSCLAVIFACSWVSVHPNIPERGGGRVKKVLRRLELMFWSIITPEFIIMWAMRQWWSARKLEQEYRDHGWTKTHGYFIQMGGFTLYKGNESMGVLSAEKLRTLLEQKKVKIPTITEEDIQDRSKGDGLAKALVIIQTSWFIVQCIARGVEGLFITQLELITLAFAALNSFMYFFWWNMPLNVLSTVEVHILESACDQMPVDNVGNDETADEQDPLLSPSVPPSDIALSPKHRHWYTGWKPVIKPIWWLLSGLFFRWPGAVIVAIFYRMDDMAQFSSDPVLEGLMRVPTFYAFPIPPSAGSRYTVKIFIAPAASFMAALFGAIHCAGWFFTFPTDIEAIFWRVCSLIIVGIPLAVLWYLFLYFIEKYFLTWSSSGGNNPEVIYPLLMLLLSLYMLARVGLLVEALVALRDVPSGAFDVVTWTTFLPHI